MKTRVFSSCLSYLTFQFPRVVVRPNPVFRPEKVEIGLGAETGLAPAAALGL